MESQTPGLWGEYHPFVTPPFKEMKKARQPGARGWSAAGHKGAASRAECMSLTSILNAGPAAGQSTCGPTVVGDFGCCCLTQLYLAAHAPVSEGL